MALLQQALVLSERLLQRLREAAPADAEGVARHLEAVTRLAQALHQQLRAVPDASGTDQHEYHPHLRLLWAAALEAFGDPAKAQLWMRRPRASLGTPTRPMPPAEFGQTAEGTAYLLNALGQVAHGISP